MHTNTDTARNTKAGNLSFPAPNVANLPSVDNERYAGTKGVGKATEIKSPPQNRLNFHEYVLEYWARTVFLLIGNRFI